MVEESNAMDVAAMVFEHTRSQPSEAQVIQLARQLLALEQRGLSKLNRRLTDSGRKMWDTFAEHNFAGSLIEHLPPVVPLLYEPDNHKGRVLGRPPDFVVQLGSLTVWIQMKKLAVTERESRQDKAIGRIKALSVNVKTPLFFWCDFAPTFELPDVEEFLNFVAGAAVQGVHHKPFAWPSATDCKVEVTFWPPRKTVLEHLTLGGAGDLEAVDVTGESCEQIGRSLQNAAGAFDWDTDDANINLIVMEIGSQSHGDIDVADAVFGEEIPHHVRGEAWSFHREGDGFFNDPEFASRVAGVVVRRREKHEPICPYHTTLFINESFLDRIEQIQSAVSFDKLIRFHQWLDH